ncbi:MAG TPA: POT family MFS transporter [Candidatus Didemnitutus sp.]|nr:POT family MFS transporter [Candidatus Didemnitutus sp.]
MADSKFLTTPVNTDKMPPGIPYIVGNEAAERFNFYGLKAILVIYMTQYLCSRSGALAPMSENDANKWFHLFVGGNYFFPMLGAIVADAFWGKYRTVFWVSFIYCAGGIFLAADHTRLGLAVGLALIALGAGGIKPCVASNVGDQFGPANQHLVSRAFGWFYFAINFGSSFSMWFVPIWLKEKGPGLAFSVPAALMLVATFVFWMGRYKYVHVPPRGRTFIRDTFNRGSLTILLRLALIFVFLVPFWALWDQSGGEWVLQADKMERHIFGHEILASQLQVVNGVMILAFIPLFQYLIYPAVSRVWKLTPLRKIGLGIFTIGTSFLVSAWIDAQISTGAKPSICWQLPAFALLSAGEVMASITALEFAYTQAPKHLKAIVQAIFYLSISGGNFFTAGVHWFIANPDGSLKLQGAPYYFFFAGLSMIAAIIFSFVAMRYKEVSYEEELPVPLAEAAAET